MRFLGDYWENVAYKYLVQNKLKKVKKNFNCKAGEVDLIMLDQNTLVFIEVKYRKESDWVTGLEAVTKTKQKRIIKAAKLFLLQNKQYKELNCRFDVVSIQGDKQNPEISWIENAFY